MTRGAKGMLLLGLAALLVSSTGAQDEPMKVGVVDVDAVLNATEAGRAAREELSRKQREAEAQVQPMMERYNNLKEEIKGKKYVLSEEALFEKQVELAELQNKIENKLKELEGQLKIDQGRMIAPLENKLRQIIEDLGKEQGFTLILRRGAPGIMYTREALDITDLVVERFNKSS
ncbi:MAG: OmpH family outer membrane protein [Myxococcota bacterium]|nr:OmpH family outer membrane protein [Myxococcota bacterium]